MYIREDYKIRKMKTLNITISDEEYEKFGFKDENLSFSEFVEIINKELQKLNMRKSVELAEKYNLSKLTMDEITEEVRETTYLLKSPKNAVRLQQAIEQHKGR